MSRKEEEEDTDMVVEGTDGLRLTFKAYLKSRGSY